VKMSPRPQSTGMLPLPSLTSLATVTNSAVSQIRTSVHIAISPTFLNNLKTGVESQLAPHVNRYFPPLKAILLGYDQLKLTSRTGALLYDNPAVHVDVEGTFFIFSPEVGDKLPGIVNKKCSGHLGCLVHKTFNVSLLAGDTEKDVNLNEEVFFEVTRLFWGFNGFPVIQGKMVRDHGEVEGDLLDYDSGIDSSLSQGHQEHEIKSEVKVEGNKKSKKRKREAEPEVKLEESEVKIKLEESSDSPKKKKKKKAKD